MRIQEDIHPVTVLKSRAAELLDQINKTQRPIVITQNGVPRAVLQDPESYERTRQAMGLLKLLAQGEEDVRAGRTVDQDQLFRRLRAQLKGHTRNHGKP